MSYEQRQRLHKRKQELLSWQWFYLNSSEQLMASRYPKASKLITDKSTGEFKRVTIIPYLGFSKRFEEDRQAAFKIGLEVKGIQERIDKLNKDRNKRND